MRTVAWWGSAVMVVVGALAVLSCGKTSGGLCRTDPDCVPGERCDAENGLCVLAPLGLEGASLEAFAGQPFHHALSATGGAPPYAWALQGVAPELEWLSVEAEAGILGGTPAEVAPAASFEVVVTDSAGSSVTAAFDLTVLPCTAPCVVGCTPGEVCRAAAGACDVPEVCTEEGACPADALAAAGTVCRPEVGPCDLTETCSGSSAGCPADALLPATTECRSSAGACDPAENCTGVQPQCPADAVEPPGTVCRASAGDCDVEETCDGASAQCPQDAFLSPSTECRAAAGDCDVAESCPGDGPLCPQDLRADAGTTCRPAVNTCDLGETCDGAGVTCPQDVFQPANTPCSMAQCQAGTYTPPGTCLGGAPTCQTPASVSCNGYQCSGQGCGTTCIQDAQCLGTHFCQPGNQCAPKRQDGQVCSGAGAGNECVSGVCKASYPDADGDGHGDDSAPAAYYCGAAAPAGRSLSKTDCCDTDNRAHPAQSSYFTTARTGCGGFDYDCDGSSSKQYLAANACSETGSCGADNLTCQSGTGWEAAAPACGASDTYVTSCFAVPAPCPVGCIGCDICDPVTTTRTQGCR